ncbi:phosphoenolpyruvate--protein phosphotransferase [Desulfovibrio sp. OttesenSCG-928-G15]|nr:phosphoenolpyruvate--protein phosphotransferase [Desulfovibrio sp. OttesenSCG-928-G15]
MNISPQRIALLAPLSGTVVPIGDVPDPVFSQKMLGEGIAIDPSDGMLVAPCSGTVSQLHSAGHALTITTQEGVEVLLHIGLDTVTLKGAGFQVKVALGMQVDAGQQLVEFDKEYIAAHAPSVLTMMVVSDNDSIVDITCATGTLRAASSTAMEITLKGQARDLSKTTPSGGVESSPLLLRNPNGIHARPAAILVSCAKRFSSDITLYVGRRKANAKSVTSILALGAKQHEQLIITAEGPDAQEAIATLVPLVEAGLGENVTEPIKTTEAFTGAAVTGSTPDRAAPPAQAPAPASPEGPRPDVITGITTSPGTALGKICHWRRDDLTFAESGQNPKEECRALENALGKARDELLCLEQSLRDKADAGKAAIFSAHAELLEDPELLKAAHESMTKGKSAAGAWRDAVEKQAKVLSSMSNELLAARAEDVRDVGRRVLGILVGTETPDSVIDPDSIIVAQELTPSELERLANTGIRGICTLLGSATSHASLLARSYEIPAMAAVDERILDVADGTPVVLYADAGKLKLDPPAEEQQLVLEQAKRKANQRADMLREAAKPAVTTDGLHIGVQANINGIAEVDKLLEYGGEGVGLLRSEFLFLQRTSPPDEYEQSQAYLSIAQKLGPDRKMVLRTLDVGGDKPLAYLPLPHEPNPALGMRGIRINMLVTDFFRTQVRAVLRCARHTRLHIIFPMVSDVSEMRAARQIVDEEIKNLDIASPVTIGIMVEVPSIALLAESLAPEVEYFSIGTNDLTQHTLAIDRSHPKLAAQADALHPAVLKMIAMTVEGAHKHNKRVGVCGGLAADPLAVPVLIGLGVDELSVSVDALPQIKSKIRQLDSTLCKSLAADALTMLTAREVRSYLTRCLSES